MEKVSLSEDKRYFEDFMKQFLDLVDPELSHKYKLPEDREAAKLIANSLHTINRFIYTQSSKLKGLKCMTRYGSADYFSEFHKFWEENNKQILDIYVNDEKCKEVAESLESNYRPFSPSSIVDVKGLSPQQIANTRLFTAIQDFGFGLRLDYYSLARQRPYLFNPEEISRHPEYTNQLLTQLGVSDYQPDKRIEWISRCARLLVDRYGGTAFNIGKVHNYDVVAIREALLKANIGIDAKNADMFLRDMQELQVWNLKRFEEVSVASDMNTMRIALRTGITHTRVPLFSSFMDVFCYHYSAVDETTAKAWRRAWELWRELPNNHSVTSPAYIDYLIYNMGRRCCRSKRRRCEVQCSRDEQKRCILNRFALPNCGDRCIFKGICDEASKNLNPPKSISIFGKYGWTTAYSDEGGGLGLRC